MIHFQLPARYVELVSWVNILKYMVIWSVCALCAVPHMCDVCWVWGCLLLLFHIHSPPFFRCISHIEVVFVVCASSAPFLTHSGPSTFIRSIFRLHCNHHMSVAILECNAYIVWLTTVQVGWADKERMMSDGEKKKRSKRVCHKLLVKN